MIINSLIILKLSLLFIGILYTIANALRTFYKNDIPPMFVLLQTIGLVGFSILQFELYK